jgi:hypothetical protein
MAWRGVQHCDGNGRGGGLDRCVSGRRDGPVEGQDSDGYGNQRQARPLPASLNSHVRHSASVLHRHDG